MIRSGEISRGQAPNKAYLQYTWSNVGEIFDLCGTFWNLCPAWWARYYDGPLNVVCDGAIELSVIIKRGAVALVAAGDHLPSGDQLRLALQAQSMIDSLNAQDQKRELDEIKKKQKR
jgi:hypothetical protein